MEKTRIGGNMVYDKIIIGAGIYGLYSALYCGKLGQKILVLEYESEPFKRATYINQARVHMGYHYPRSYTTALKSAQYFNRFNEDFSFCINDRFEQIYATSSKLSWTNAEQFRKFCSNTKIRCEDITPLKYFKEEVCDGAFFTTEYSYDAHILRDYFLNQLFLQNSVEIRYCVAIKSIKKEYNQFEIEFANDRETVASGFVLNATYASVNQILKMIDAEPFKIKYELCEIILCDVQGSLKNVGLTVMDGPFFSVMPFGKTGFHSLTSVTFTPHMTSYDTVPNFTCQKRSEGFCSPSQLKNCNDCKAKPKSAWNFMAQLAGKYLKPEYIFKYHQSLYSVKPILKVSEIDDSRPTVIKQFSSNPTFISVLSGKINTVYDLEEVLK